MRHIKKLLLKIYMFMTSGVAAKYLISALMCMCLFVILSVFRLVDYLEVINILIGFLLGQIVVGLMNVIGSKFEDITKVTEDTNKLLTIYTLKKYDKKVKKNGSVCSVCYNEVFVPNKNSPEELHVDDIPENVFNVDDFFMNNYTQLFQAHEHSTKKNFVTARLDAFTKEQDGWHFKIGRSTYYHHLITNRAADFRLADDFSVREMFEFGPKITPLEESKMSNHIGINALVYLEDGALLIPKRKRDSTFSKNKITSSIAVMLNIPKDGKIDKDYLIDGGLIKKELVGRTKIPQEVVDKLDVTVNFIGFGQNIYEVGKPQFYYEVYLKGLDKKGYENCTTLKEKTVGIKLDRDEIIYMIDPNTIKFFGDGDIKFNYYTHRDIKKNKKTASKQRHLTYEKSFACNIWHEQMYNSPDKYEEYLREIAE